METLQDYPDFIDVNPETAGLTVAGLARGGEVVPGPPLPPPA